MSLRLDDKRAWYAPVTITDGGSTCCDLPTDPKLIGILTLPSKSYWSLFVPKAAAGSYVVLWLWPPQSVPDALKLTVPKPGEFRPDPFVEVVEEPAELVAGIVSPMFDPADPAVKAVGVVRSCERPFLLLCPGPGWTLGIRLVGSSGEPVCYLTRVMVE